MGEKVVQMTAIEKKFLAYHHQNPEIYDALVKLARQAKRAGKEKIGIKMLWEVMRWNRFLETNDPDRYKLNNNYPSRYARLIMDQEMDLDGLFDVRKLRSE
jgi:hypothetical protein